MMTAVSAIPELEPRVTILHSPALGPHKADFSPEALAHTQEQLHEQLAGSALTEAFDTVVEATANPKPVDREAAVEPQWLFAADLCTHRGLSGSDEPVGLLYARDASPEATRVEVLSSIAVGAWIMPEKTYLERLLARMDHTARNDIRAALYRGFVFESGLHGATRNALLAHVDASTQIDPLPPAEDGVLYPFRYAHLDDMLAVTGLSIPRANRAFVAEYVSSIHANLDRQAQEDSLPFLLK